MKTPIISLVTSIFLLAGPAAAAIPGGQELVSPRLEAKTAFSGRVRVALNPQPIPPRTERSRVVRGDRVKLNPQPIPPREVRGVRSRSR